MLLKSDKSCFKKTGLKEKTQIGQKYYFSLLVISLSVVPSLVISSAVNLQLSAFAPQPRWMPNFGNKTRVIIYQHTTIAIIHTIAIATPPPDTRGNYVSLRKIPLLVNIHHWWMIFPKGYDSWQKRLKSIFLYYCFHMQDK